MFRNYLVIALRNIVRHKLYSFINIAGLAVGLACVILIILFVRDELSYDKWIPGSDKLYRVEDDLSIRQAARPLPLAQTSHADAVGHARQDSRGARATRLGAGEHGDDGRRPAVPSQNA